MAARPPQNPKKSDDAVQLALLAGAAGNLKDKTKAAASEQKGGSDVLTAIVTVAIVVIILAVMIYTNKPVTG